MKEDVKPVTEEPETAETQAPESEAKPTTPEPKDEKATNKTQEAEKKKEKKPTIVTLKEPIKAEEVTLGPQSLKDEELAETLQK